MPLNHCATTGGVFRIISLLLWAKMKSSAYLTYVRLRRLPRLPFIPPRVVPCAQVFTHCRFDLSFHAVQCDIGQEGGSYTSYKVANLPIEFSRSIPWAQLRPGMVTGFEAPR